MLKKSKYVFHTVSQTDDGQRDPRVKYMTSDDSVSVTTVFTSPSSHLYTGAKRTFVMEWSSFKTTYHDPTKLGTSIDEEYKTEQIRVEETATCTESLGLDLEPVLDHRTSVLHTNLDVLKQNVKNVLLKLSPR